MPDQALEPLDETPSSIPSFPPISPALRCELKGLAHHLPPAVMLGQQGLTDNIVKAILAYFNQSNLIKIRVLSADHDQRVEIAQQISDRTGAELVQHIGRQIIFYRPLIKKKKASETTKAKPARKRSFRLPPPPSTRPKPKASYTHRHRTSKSPGK